MLNATLSSSNVYTAFCNVTATVSNVTTIILNVTTTFLNVLPNNEDFQGSSFSNPYIARST
jgi:hypothetical protein